MIDMTKPRLTEWCADAEEVQGVGGSLSGRAVKNRLFELENAIESGELAPVVHGKWENRINEYFRTCSNCEISMGMLDGESLERFCYCPFCGAKMDGKENKSDEV